MSVDDESRGIVEIVFYGQKISSQDAADFLNAKASGDQSCPVCRITNWEMSFGPGDGSYAVLPSAWNKGDGTVLMPGQAMAFPVFSVTCANCGYARFHSMFNLSDWLKTRNGDV